MEELFLLLRTTPVVTVLEFRVKPLHQAVLEFMPSPLRQLALRGDFMRRRPRPVALESSLLPTRHRARRTEAPLCAAVRTAPEFFLK